MYICTYFSNNLKPDMADWAHVASVTFGMWYWIPWCFIFQVFFEIIWTCNKMNTVCASVNHLMMGILNLSGEIRCIFESDDQWWRPNIGIDHHQIAHIIIWLISNLSKFVTIFNSSNKSIHHLRTDTYSTRGGNNWIRELICVCALKPSESFQFC